MNSYKKPAHVIAIEVVLYAVFSIPHILSILWAMSLVCLGLGIAFPYIVISCVQDIGSIRVALFGTLIHVFMFLMLIAPDKLGDIWPRNTEGKYFFDGDKAIDRAYFFAFAEFMTAGLLFILVVVDWSW